MLAFSTTIIAFFAVFANLASGSPVPEPQPQPSQNPCSPSFQGVATYIQAYDTYNRLWVPAGSQQSTVISTLSGGQTRWRVEGTGSANNDYHIKLVMMLCHHSYSISGTQVLTYTVPGTSLLPITSRCKPGEEEALRLAL